MKRSRPRGFSLIELMVVIGLIALLSTLLLIGVGKLITNGKRQATQLAFQNCQAMYGEWDRIARQHFPSWNDPGINNVNVPSPQDLTTAVGDRQGNSVLLTRDVMTVMKTMPVNSAALGKMSVKASMTFQYASPPAAPQPVVPPLWAAGTSYNVADRVQNGVDANGTPLGYVCIRTVPYTPYNSTPYYAPTTDTGYWFPATIDPSSSQVTSTWNVSTVPVLLDGWGNPIIFVPSGALAGVTAGGAGITVKSADGRPFWASAGPDGVMNAGDDNMYSFEK